MEIDRSGESEELQYQYYWSHRGIKEYYGAGKEVPIAHLKTIGLPALREVARDWDRKDEAERAQRELKRREQEDAKQKTERLIASMNTENPPPAWLRKADESRTNSILLTFAAGAFWIICAVLVVSFYPGNGNRMFRIALFFLPATISYLLYREGEKLQATASELRKTLTLHNYEYHIPIQLKGGAKPQIEITFQLPENYDSEPIKTRLRTDARVALSSELHDKERLPTPPELVELLRLPLAKAYRELHLPLLRYHITEVGQPPSRRAGTPIGFTRE